MTTKTICVCGHPISEHTYSEDFTGCDQSNCVCNLDMGAYIDNLNGELTDAKARAAAAEKGWHANEARIGKLESELRFIHGITMGDGDHDKVVLAKDADIFMQCFKALGLDVSGTDPEEIVDAIKRLMGDL